MRSCEIVLYRLISHFNMYRFLFAIFNLFIFRIFRIFILRLLYYIRKSQNTFGIPWIVLASARQERPLQ